MPKPKGLIGIRNKIDKFFSPAILFFNKFGVKANHITLLQAPFVVVMFWFLINQNYAPATLFLGVTLLLDVLDGSWARVTNDITEKGHKYDKALDLIGIYAFLLGVTIAEPQLIPMAVALGIINAVLYASNEFIHPEYYCGVRAFGFLGLLTLVKPFLQISILLGIILLIVKIIKFQSQHKPGDGRKAAKA